MAVRLYTADLNKYKIERRMSMRVLENLKPEKVFYYFEEICSIPHGSGNMRAISDYCVKFAKERGLWVKQDSMGNVIIRKAASAGYEDAESVILQGHMDMVCEKTRESTIDFEKDGLELCTDGKMVWANGTTLGGDDGIAVAYALAVLDAEDIDHPMIEAIFTVDEEIGLLGAVGIDLSEVQSRRLINLDSEEEGIFLTSCAGGLSLECKVPVSYEDKTGILGEIEVSGCKGGHSGVEIHKGRVNSNQAMGRVLDALDQKGGCQLISLAGGSKDNAIPRYTSGKIVWKDTEEVHEIAGELQEELRGEYAGKDDELTVTVKELSDKPEKAACLDRESKGRVLNALMNLPNGVQAMSADVEGLVETSLNMGIMTLEKTGDKEGILTMKFAVRSSKDSAKNYLARRTIAMVEQMGGKCSISGVYPGWDYRRESSLRNTFIKAYEKLYGKTPVCEGIHAGVECGLFTGKVPDMDCISLGPNMQNVHTAEERLEIASVERTWNLLLEVLASK